MPTTQLSAAEFIKLMDVDTRGPLLQSIKGYPDAIGVLCYENVDLGSREVGHKFFIPYGPSNTIKELRDGKSPVTPPGGGRDWQYYLYAWCPREELVVALTPKEMNPEVYAALQGYPPPTPTKTEKAVKGSKPNKKRR